MVGTSEGTSIVGRFLVSLASRTIVLSQILGTTDLYRIPEVSPDSNISVRVNSSDLDISGGAF